MAMERQLDLPGSGDPPIEEIPGLRLVSGFLSPIEEMALLAAIDREEGTWSNTLQRRVQHYGYQYDYKSRALGRRAAFFPSWLTEQARRLQKAGFIAGMPDQAIVNEYLPGQGIASHVDCEPCFGPDIASVSLGSGCEMVMRHPASGRTMSLYLERGCALGLSGPARYEWTHGIPARLSDPTPDGKVLRGRRVSVTFRTVIGASSVLEWTKGGHAPASRVV